VFFAPNYTTSTSIATGVWTDINNNGKVIFEAITHGFRQIFEAVPASPNVFLIHGIAQSGGALDNFAVTLRDPDYGIDQSRFVVDAGFDFGSCAANSHCDPSLCTIQNGAKLLALYINQNNPAGNIVLIGYSMGGLIARDMILNNYYDVIANHHVAALITLGSPHLGYPYEPIDGNPSINPEARCNNLAGQMFGDFRHPASEAPPLPVVASPAWDFLDGSGNGVALSSYLYDLNSRWISDSFERPNTWFAAAGSFCSAFTRLIPDNDRGCPQGTRSDGVVCVDSASVTISSGPDLHWSDDQYSHTVGAGTVLVFCSTTGSLPLYDPPKPPAPATLLANITTLINGLP
jgi:pimeloyl-ACP methyl ester carboxylesterase